MPTMRGSSVKVIGTTALDFREYHKMKNPNAVIFNPSRNKPTPLASSLTKVQFEPLHSLNIKRCEDQQKPKRPQSALIINCNGRHVEFELEKPRPQSAAPQRARPQSAITYREKRPKSPKRPQSASTYKSTTVSSGEPPDVADLIEDIRDMVLQKRRFTRRVWKPKKAENGIQHPPPPPPPNRHYGPEDPPKENEGTPKHNGLAKFRKFKYPQNFHSYGRKDKRILRQSMVNSREIPDCLKHPRQYHFAAARQSCRYKPWASVTSVSHHHKVGSAALPHPPHLVETPHPGSPRRTKLQTNLHLELADALEAVDRDYYEDEEEEEDEADGSRNNNGSYYYKHEEDTSKNLTYTESDGDMTDRYRTSDTDRSTARTPRQEDNADLYFLTANMPKSDTNKNSANNNTSADIMNTTVTMSDIEEVGEPVYKIPGSDKSDLTEEVDEILSEDRTPPRRSSTGKNASEILDALSEDHLKWNMSGTGKAEKEEKEAGLGWSSSSTGRATRAEGSLLRWDSKGDVQTPSRKSSVGARSDTKTSSRKHSIGGGSDVKTQSRKNSIDGGSDVKTQSRKNSIGGGSDTKIPSRKGSTSSEVKAILEDTKTGADSDLDDMYDFEALSDGDDDDIGSMGSDILDELDKLEQRKALEDNKTS